MRSLSLSQDQDVANQPASGAIPSVEEPCDTTIRCDPSILGKNLIQLIATSLPISSRFSLASANTSLRDAIRDMTVFVQGNPENKKRVGEVMDFLSEIADCEKMTAMSRLTSNEDFIVLLKWTMRKMMNPSSDYFQFSSVSVLLSLMSTSCAAIWFRVCVLLFSANPNRFSVSADLEKLLAVLIAVYTASLITWFRQTTPDILTFRASVRATMADFEDEKFHAPFENKCQAFIGENAISVLKKEGSVEAYTLHRKTITRRLCADIFRIPYVTCQYGWAEFAPAVCKK